MLTKFRHFVVFWSVDIACQHLSLCQFLSSVPHGFAMRDVAAPSWQKKAPLAGGAFDLLFSFPFYLYSIIVCGDQIIIVRPFSSMPISTNGAPGSYSPSSVQGMSSAVSAVTCLTWRKISPSEL